MAPKRYTQSFCFVGSVCKTGLWGLAAGPKRTKGSCEWGRKVLLAGEAHLVSGFPSLSLTRKEHVSLFVGSRLHNRLVKFYL